MYPYERSLVRRMEGKPFALLGINSDRDRGDLRAVLEREKITWRSWWDGGGTSGPIALRYEVSGWPTIFLLDARGVIRYTDLDENELDGAIDKLMREIQ